MISPAVLQDQSADPAFGLRQGVLTPSEVLAQSISAIAPSTSAALTVPLVYALAGEGTCLAYLVAMLAMVLVALCINTFARSSASPGSLYVYAQGCLSPFWAAGTAWSLCFAYVATASSVLGGLVSFAYALLGSHGSHVPSTLVASLGAALATWIAYKDIQISARLMLYIEAISVLLIAMVLSPLLWRHGLHLDARQFDFSTMHFSAIRLGVVLAIFSFVGFESATSLGTEASRPLQTIPVAVLWSTLLCGAFFILCAYAEVLGFRGVVPGLAGNTAPLRFLSLRAGVPFAGPLIDAGVLVSMFAATLAFVIALGRLLMLMARDQLVTLRLAATSERHRTPALGGCLVAASALVPVLFLLGRGASGAEVYGWMGSLAVFGYLVAYALVAVAVIVHDHQGKRRVQNLVFACTAIASITLFALSTLFPIPPAPYSYFPALYLLFMFAAGASQWLLRRRT